MAINTTRSIDKPQIQSNTWKKFRRKTSNIPKVKNRAIFDARNTLLPLSNFFLKNVTTPKTTNEMTENMMVEKSNNNTEIFSHSISPTVLKGTKEELLKRKNKKPTDTATTPIKLKIYFISIIL